MKRILLSLFCLLAFTVTALATEERMLTLPQDQGTWYLTTFGDSDDAQYRELQTWLESHEGLAKLKSQVRFNEYTSDQIRFQRYTKDMPGLPCIRLQNERGLVVSEFWGDNMPMVAIDLYKGIKDDLQDKTSWGCLRRKRCPPKQPVTPDPPQIDIKPEPPVGPPVLVEPEPEPEPEPESRVWMLLALIAAIAGGVLGVVQGYKAEQMEKPIQGSAKL